MTTEARLTEVIDMDVDMLDQRPEPQSHILVTSRRHNGECNDDGTGLGRPAGQSSKSQLPGTVARRSSAVPILLSSSFSLSQTPLTNADITDMSLLDILTRDRDGQDA